MSRPTPIRIESRIIRTTSGDYRETRLPRWPGWWSDPDVDQRRAATTAAFAQSDIVAAIDELHQHITVAPASADEVAALVRRQWALRWITELAGSAMPALSVDDPASASVLYWQRRASSYLADHAWTTVMGLPPAIVDSGIQMAMTSSVELEPIDEPTT